MARVAGVCLLPGAGESTEDSALRSASWEQAPWPNAICLEMLFLQNSFETFFPLAVVMGNVPLGITQFLSEQWCHCIQALGSSYF